MKNILALISIGLLLYGCGSKNIDKEFSESAMVQFHGSPAVDGCGWLLEVDSEFFRPVNLPSSFLTDSLWVRVNYKTLDTYYRCAWSVPTYRDIEIVNIAKQ